MCIRDRFIIVPFCESDGYNLHQILIALLILGKQYKVIIPVVTITYSFLIKSRAGRYIDLTSEDRVDVYKRQYIYGVAIFFTGNNWSIIALMISLFSSGDITFASTIHT